MTKAIIVSAARKGAKLLDTVHPDWFKEIDIKALDLSAGAAVFSTLTEAWIAEIKKRRATRRRR